MPRHARITIAVKGWTGWSVEQPATKSVELTVSAGQALTPATVGIESFPYTLFVESVGAQHIMVTYGRMVMMNHDGTINLSAPTRGRCLIKVGCCLKLASPTMDAGTTISVTLSAVEETML